MRFSIIVPVYNCEMFISECVDSLLNQSFTDYEIILIDDGSIDSSLSVCKKYEALDSRIKVIHTENNGVSAARNLGLNEAQGELILFVDCDDAVNEHLLEYCDKAISETEADLCVFDITSDSQEIKSSGNSYALMSDEEFENLKISIFNRDRQMESICHIKAPSPCKVYRKKIIEDNGIKFIESLSNGEDGIFNLYYCIFAKKAVYIKEKMYFYRLHGGSITHKFSERTAADFRELCKEYKCFVSRKEAAEYAKYVCERAIMSLSFCCILDFCHNDNKKSYVERRKQFYDEYDFYKEDIKIVSLKHFGLKKKIILFCIKHKMFFATELLCKLQSKF